MSPIQKFALDLFAFAFIAAATLGIFYLGGVLYYALNP